MIPSKSSLSHSLTLILFYCDAQTWSRTIPIAKRRYYGRVQQAVHEFLDMGGSVVKGDMMDAKIQTFFDPQGALIVPAKRQDVNGQCTKKDGNCKGREIRDSRYNDMKASMYLLANAFRTDQQKPPDRLRTCVCVRLLCQYGRSLSTAELQHGTLKRVVVACCWLLFLLVLG